MPSPCSWATYQDAPSMGVGPSAFLSPPTRPGAASARPGSRVAATFGTRTAEAMPAVVCRKALRSSQGLDLPAGLFTQDSLPLDRVERGSFTRAWTIVLGPVTTAITQKFEAP